MIWQSYSKTHNILKSHNIRDAALSHQRREIPQIRLKFDLIGKEKEKEIKKEKGRKERRKKEREEGRKGGRQAGREGRRHKSRRQARENGIL